MAKWRVTIPHTEIEVDADSEISALIQADLEFDVIDESYAEELDEE